MVAVAGKEFHGSGKNGLPYRAGLALYGPSLAAECFTAVSLELAVSHVALILPLWLLTTRWLHALLSACSVLSCPALVQPSGRSEAAGWAYSLLPLLFAAGFAPILAEQSLPAQCAGEREDCYDLAFEARIGYNLGK
uniref:Uncharacterized protein n=1 Tax=Thermogemmatispora argillosa TaxID=2045280 RepID=A0A455T9J4_9CHLR|nr:hypothetical protein KTA_42840 [Thermogemmatispora argillosa]